MVPGSNFCSRVGASFKSKMGASFWVQNGGQFWVQNRCHFLAPYLKTIGGANFGPKIGASFGPKTWASFGPQSPWSFCVPRTSLGPQNVSILGDALQCINISWRKLGPVCLSSSLVQLLDWFQGSHRTQ